MKKLSVIDQCISEFDVALKTLLPPLKRFSARPSPALTMKDSKLSMKERKHVAGLMRVNHAGEVCAQALYQGQALTAQLVEVRTKMQVAAAEEIDHLAWCEQRLYELGSQPSLLNPIWYLGSFMLGAAAGLAGDKISLGFVAETENQVTKHLQEHLNRLPAQDNKTKLIIEQMKVDESQHASDAKDAGGIELPWLIKRAMSLISKIMTKTAYHL